MGSDPHFIGLFQIGLGTSLFVFAVILIVLPYASTDLLVYQGCGIWVGGLDILTGVFGVFSNRRKKMVIAYSTLSCVVTLLSLGMVSSFFALVVPAIYHNAGSEPMTHFNLNIVLMIVCILQGVVSIIGACKTCGAICARTNETGTNNTQELVHTYHTTDVSSAGVSMTSFGSPQSNTPGEYESRIFQQ